MGYVIHNEKGYIADMVDILGEKERIILKLAISGIKKSDLARKLGISPQLLNYYIKSKLKDFIKEEDKYIYSKKAYYIIVEDSPDFFIEKVNIKKSLKPFIKNRILDSLIVVGAPYPHGPYSAVGRDSHYVGFLLSYLGKFFDKTKYEDFIRLDVDVIKEKLLNENLILIGGPVTNTITYRLNFQLDIYFDETNNWNIYDKFSKKVYSDEFSAIIANIDNPYNTSKRILIIAGKKAIGTKIAIKYFIKRSYDLSKKFIEVIRGMDLDGDGNIDKVNQELFREI